MINLKKESVATAVAQIARTKYQTIVTSQNHTIVADEPATLNGTDTGMNPYSLLLASLSSCTVITLRMYIDRKMWIVDEITVNVEIFKVEGGTLIERQLSFNGELNDEQKQRLVQIADACPIHKLLVGNIMIETALK
jgi:putative redox protein